jgi:IS5 family transposase
MRNSFETEPARFVSSPALDHPSLHGFEDTEVALSWTRLEALMGRRCASTTGRPSCPFLALFRSLLQGIWYKLSDEQLAASLARHLLFRHFCRFELFGDILDATTLGRFRQQLVQYGLWERLLEEVKRQLEAHQVIISKGRVNIIDATPVSVVRFTSIHLNSVWRLLYYRASSFPPLCT